MTPEIGKKYHIFDDGKVRPTRHFVATVLEVISFADCKDEDLIAAWKDNVESSPWLFALETDYFIKAESDFDEDYLYFVRTKDGGWFSMDITSWWQGARLDIDGSLYKIMVEQYGEDSKKID